MRPSLQSALLLVGSLLFVLGLPQKPKEPAQPAKWSADIVNFSDLWIAYRIDPRKADKQYKRKRHEILEVGNPSFSKVLLRDGEGRRYLPIFMGPMSGPKRWEEIARCYLLRPENPIVAEEDGADTFGVTGDCRGLRGGILILENCTIFTHRAIMRPNW